MPEPRPDETHEDYIKRCIPAVINHGTAGDGTQGVAICESMWRAGQSQLLSLSLPSYAINARGRARVRREKYKGRDHLVVPVVALVGDSVVRPMNSRGAEFVPATELAAAPQGWDGRPCVPDHPNGGRTSANTLDVAEQLHFGFLSNSRYEDGRLKTDAYLDIERARSIPEAQAILDRINAGETVEVSVGAFVMADLRSGTAGDGTQYAYVWRSIVPDHLAFLSAGIQGACSVSAGCGAPRVLGGPGSGNFGHKGRPGEIGGSAPSSGGGGSDGPAPATDGNTVAEWQDPGGWRHTGVTWDQPTDAKSGRPIPIKARNVEEAVDLVLQGKVVEVEDVGTVHTLVSRLAQIAEDAAALGKDAPSYDLCNVSVAGTNLFCAENLGIDRNLMPQFKTVPVEGTEAAKLPRDKNGEVDGSSQFLAFLQGVGMKTSFEDVPAASLRASQRELVGAKVAGMMASKTYDPGKEPIFISRDNYVVDGHHRWAAYVARDARNGILGDEMKMHVRRIDAPISEVLHISRRWAARFGLKQKAAFATGAPKVLAYDPNQPRDDHGRWTGIGAAPASAIEAIQVPDGGFSYHAYTGHTPVKGYIVSTHKEREQWLNVKDVTGPVLARFAKANRDLLRDKDNYVGGWHDPKTGKVSLDVSTVVKSASTAEKLGRKAGQISYFDFNKGVSVTIAPEKPHAYPQHRAASADPGARTSLTALAREADALRRVPDGGGSGEARGEADRPSSHTSGTRGDARDPEMSCRCNTATGAAPVPRAATVAQKRTPTRTPTTNPRGGPMDNTELVERVLSAKGSPFTEECRESLAALTGEQLTVLAGANYTPEEPETPAPKTEDEWLATAPETLRSMVGRYKREEVERRKALISNLSGAQKVFTLAALEAKPTEELQALSALLALDKPEPVDFSLRAASTGKPAELPNAYAKILNASA